MQGTRYKVKGKREIRQPQIIIGKLKNILS
jgi:hypothetical protein